MHITAIISISMILGLIAGASSGIVMVVPVTLLAAIVLFINRHKIAAQATIPHDDEVSYPVLSDAQYFTWPALGQFTHSVAGDCNQSMLKRLWQNDALLHYQAYLIPIDTDAYDSKAVQIGINCDIVGQFDPIESRSFRHRLDENGRDKQITRCCARIVYDEKDDQYFIQLDIEPLTLYELPLIAG